MQHASNPPRYVMALDVPHVRVYSIGPMHVLAPPWFQLKTLVYELSKMYER